MTDPRPRPEPPVSSAASGTDALYAITEEMAARSEDPRCPRPLALLLAAWVNALNKGIAEMRDARKSGGEVSASELAEARAEIDRLQRAIAAWSVGEDPFPEDAV